MSRPGALAAAAFIGLACGTARARPPEPAACPDIKGEVREADVRCALGRWLAMANAHRADDLTALYAQTHVLLLSTLHAEPYTDQEKIRAYFDGLVARPGFGVRLTDYPEKIDLFPGGGADSGFYRFRWRTRHGETVAPARFTFVFVLDATGRRLVIATHHSSVLPEAK
jgi:hypothetical protein